MKRNHVQFFQQELFTRSFMEEMTALAPIKAIISFRWLPEALLIVWRNLYQHLMGYSGLPKTPLVSVILQRGFVSLIRSTKEILLPNKMIFSYSPECKDEPGQLSHSSVALPVPWGWSLVPRELREKKIHWLLQWRCLLTPRMPVGFNPANKRQFSLTMGKKIASETQFLFSPPWHI